MERVAPALYSLITLQFLVVGKKIDLQLMHGLTFW